MEWKTMAGALVLATGAVGCGGGEGSQAAPQAPPAAVERPSPESEEPVARPPYGMRMGEREAGRMGAAGEGMMGGNGELSPAVPAVPAPAQEECPPVADELVTSGRAVFMGPGRCAACHGPNGRGSGMGPDLRDSFWLDIDGSYGSIVKVIRNGVPNPREFPEPMPPKGGSHILPRQVCQVAAYVYSLSHYQ